MPAARAPAPVLLQVAGGLLAAATLPAPGTPLETASQLIAATGVLAFVVGLFAARGMRPGPLVGMAVAGVAFVVVSVLAGWLHDLPVEQALQPRRLVVELPIILAVGLLGRRPRAVAVSGLAVVLATTGWIVPAINPFGIAVYEFRRMLPSLALVVLGTAALIAALAVTRPGRLPVNGPAAPEPS